MILDVKLVITFGRKWKRAGSRGGFDAGAVRAGLATNYAPGRAPQGFTLKRPKPFVAIFCE
jgi:hypothetical protein